MKRLLAFFSFARAERLGIVLPAILLMLLVLVRFSMSLWAHPDEVDAAQQQRLLVAYDDWKAKNAVEVTSGPTGARADGALFAFDPNTLDSAGFIRLGMPPRAVKGLLNWRRHNKHFYKPEDLKPLYNLPEDVYARLEPYIRIQDTTPYGKSGFTSSFAPIPDVIDLNSADSTLLDRGVPGIGAILSRKIVQRRAALGGFIKHEQLLEVYRFPDTTFQRIKGKLHINATDVRRMDLNTSTLSQLASHPYIGEQMAKNIVLYREGIKHYESVEQLRQVPLMNEEIYRKIAPYFRVSTSE
jgi:DNA uptake protein ComE-like DNA-binding protein